MDKKILLEVLKYIALTCLVYIIFKYLPNRTLENYDIVTLTIIVVLSIVLIENLYRLYAGEPACSTPPTVQQCSSVCAVGSKEHMTNTKGVSEQMLQPKSLEMPLNVAIVPPEKSEQKLKQELLQELRQEIRQELLQESNEKLPQGPSLPKINSEQLVEGLDNLAGAFFHMKTQSPQENQNIQRGEISRRCDGVMNNELKFNVNNTLPESMDYTDFNHVPVPEDYNKDDFEYGYSFLPPDKWYPQPPFPPMCVTDKRCPVFPVNTIGTPIDVKEWNSSRRITPPDNINTNYVINKLNNGR